MDGLMLGFVARELKSMLPGGRVDRVLQPEKDELHVLIRTREGTRRLLLCAAANSARAHITQEVKPNPDEPPMFCMLLRKLLGGSRVEDVRQVDGDRILEIVFSCTDELGDRTERVLCCEMMGRHSNLILRGADGRIADAIRHVGADVSRVREVRPGIAYQPPPSQGKLNPFSPSASAQELAFRLTGQPSPMTDAAARAALAEPLRALLDALPSFGPPVLLLNGDGEPCDVFPFPQRHLSPEWQREVPEGPSAALDAFYRLRDRRERMAQKSASLARSLKTHIERCEKRLAIHEETLAASGRIEEARICGELLTAHLHQIKKGEPSVTLEDYYSGKARTIALDTRLTPAQNAQKYYRQYQKLRQAQLHAAGQAEQARTELAMLEAQLDDLRKCAGPAELDEIRALLAASGHLRASHSRGKARHAAPSQPMRFVSADGYEILVGRNSAQNDRLTAAAPPDALWLHAKDMAGSHVVVPKGGDIPEATLRQAALLAAWFSRGYRSAQVPVDYTRRRFVKKPGGAPAGFVLYTHQRTLYVTPDERAVRALSPDGTP